jgi:thioredoxin 1
MEPFLTVTDVTFDSEVLSAEGDVLVEAGARWCPPCKALHQVLSGIARERAELKIVTIDVEESPDVARRFQVRATPTLLLFRNGEHHASRVGAAARERILEWLDG